ncbi:myeloid differentiation primary response protein MyD88 [Leptinotarsa decemlineata]|uniref:myeloid differentiation primary response protein MyD88 n=1 Tax=Leptinotarsa decemlineata TaxID=7539 RepID=UPI003D3084CF
MYENEFQVSINALGKEAKEVLSLLLNSEKVFLTKEKVPRDWRGLAELCGINGQYIPNYNGCDDKVKRILKTWQEKKKEECTIGKLLSFLERLDRYDVVDDIIPIVEKDIEYFKLNPVVYVDPPDSDDEDLLTYEDVKRKAERKPLRIYEAFLLFDDADIDFATNIVKTLEGQYNMKFCVKDRDIRIGKLERPAVIKMITRRCRKVIVVVSPSFWTSASNKFFYNLAQVDSLENGSTNIIPCMEKPCEVPIEFKVYHTLIFSRTQQLFGNFWDLLNQSINPPVIRNEVKAVEKKSIETTPKNINHVKFEAPNVETEDHVDSAREENNCTISSSAEICINISEENSKSEKGQVIEKKNVFSKIFKKIRRKSAKKQAVLEN